MTGRYRAVIFDLDGVIWDGEPLYHEAFNVVLAPYGHTVTESDYSRIIGLSVEAAWDWVRQHFSLSESPAVFYRVYNDAVLELMKRLGVPPGECLAFEDTPSGIASAKAAGMFAVQVRAGSTALPPLPQADMVI